MSTRGLKWFLTLPYKVTFWPPMIYVRNGLSARRENANIRRWRAHLRRGSSIVHKSVEIRGHDLLRARTFVGNGCFFERDCTVWLSSDAGNNSRLEMGHHVFVGRNTYLGSYQPLKIGSNTLIGAYTYIISANHTFCDPSTPVRLQGYNGAPVTIGEDVWIGCHVVILPGVTIGDRAVVGAHALVNKSIPQGEIWGGVPAKKLGMRDSNASSNS